MADTPLPDDRVSALRELLAGGRFQEALDIFRGSGAAAQQPEAQLLAATAATRQGDLGLGTALAMEALERFRARADDDGRMRVMNLLGAVKFEQGDLETSHQCFAEALRLAQQLQDSLMVARISNNLASVSHLRGDLPDALRLYRSALLGFQRLGDRHFIAETYHNLGLTFRQATELQEAETAAGQAVRHAELLEDRALMALTMTGRAELRVEQGELALAHQELDRASRLAVAAGDPIGTAEVQRVRALTALREANYGRAAQEAESARLVAEEHNSALLKAECSAAAAFAHRALGQVEQSERRRAEALEGFRKLGAVRLLELFERKWSNEA